jgi:hypothetical protein
MSLLKHARAFRSLKSTSLSPYVTLCIFNFGAGTVCGRRANSQSPSLFRGSETGTTKQSQWAKFSNTLFGTAYSYRNLPGISRNWRTISLDGSWDVAALPLSDMRPVCAPRQCIRSICALLPQAHKNKRIRSKKPLPTLLFKGLTATELFKPLWRALSNYHVRAGFQKAAMLRADQPIRV